MPRTILVHLNVEAPDSEERTPDELADLMLAAINNAGELSGEFKVICPLSEEV